MTFTNTVLFVHTVNKALLTVNVSNVSNIYNALCTSAINHEPLSVYRVVKVKTLKSTHRLSNLKYTLKVTQKQHEIHFVKCLHPCKLFFSIFIAVRWTMLYYCMGLSSPLWIILRGPLHYKPKNKTAEFFVAVLLSLFKRFINHYMKAGPWSWNLWKSFIQLH